MNELKKFDHELFGHMLGMKNPSQAMKDAYVSEENKVTITNKTPFNGLLEVKFK